MIAAAVRPARRLRRGTTARYGRRDRAALTDGEVPEYADWIVGAKKLLQALKYSGFFDK
jgi:hypothetical protein